VIEVIHAVAFGLFWVFLIVGGLTTLGRLMFYRTRRHPRPKLLVRDAILVGGLSWSFGLILLVRALDATWLRDNLIWVIATDVPAIIAVGVYAYYELFVIERGANARRDYPLGVDEDRPGE